MNKQHINFKHDQAGSIKSVSTDLHGEDIIHNPLLNKGTAFTKKERALFGLDCYLPECIETLDEQVIRAHKQLQEKENDIQKYIYLNQLHDTNVTLFYELASRNIEEVFPLIYTPTVGAAVEQYSHIMRRPQGIYLSYNHQDKIDEVFSEYNADDIDFIIVTDGEAVLGIGDQGIGGMEISIGKLMVYIACAGLNPARVLPIQLDVGTNNERLLKDEEYLGWRHKRLEGSKYDSFIGRFVKNVQKHFPKVYLHWEDFGRGNARRILEKYRQEMSTFNDDMQGTGIVAAANVIAGVHAAGGKLKEQKIIMFGAGTAGCGIADQIRDVLESAGLTQEQARGQIYLVDRFGMVTDYLKDVPSFQLPYLKSKDVVASWEVSKEENISLAEAVKNIQPTILIGVSTVKGAFSKEIVQEMASHIKHPIIMPLSNPNSLSEATPEDLIKWTDGNAIIAAGSPYNPVKYKGKTYRISQGNNMFIFPGLGLGTIAVQANRMTNNMIRAACIKLSEFSPSRKDKTAPLLPPVSQVTEVSAAVAIAVAEQAIKDGVAEKKGDLTKLINQAKWTSTYYSYTKSE